MKHDSCRSSFFRSLFLSLILLSSSVAVLSQQPAPQTTQPTPPPKPSPSPATAKDLIAKGVALYRQGKYDQAAKQFMAALKLEPENDEALGYASLTAYQQGNLSQSRDLFQRRADLPNQKSSVKIFSTYMVALTRWRQAHEIIARKGELKLPQTVYKLTEKELTDANTHLNAGLDSIKKVLSMKSDYAEAINVNNLLHAEVALITTDAAKAEEHRKDSLDALRQAIKLNKSAGGDFGAPTLLIGEFANTDADQNQMTDPMLTKLEGGRPISRANAALPVIKIAAARPRSQDGAPPPTGVGPGGSAVSVGPGQGALRPSKPEVVQLKGGVAKVEVLLNSAGKIVFTRILSGPAATTGPALAAAKKWTFSVPRFEGNPVQVLGVISFNVKSLGKGTKSK